MTKPDMLPAGSTKALEIWLDVIEGRKHPLKHGYFCMRQLNDAERTQGVSYEAARLLEQAFFKTTQPWASSRSLNRFGRGNLVSSLSILLINLINER